MPVAGMGRRPDVLASATLPCRSPARGHVFAMLNDLWVERSAYAKWWLFGAVVVQTVLFVIAAIPAARESFWYGGWTAREAMVLLSMALLLLGAFAMHYFDKKKQGWGFSHVYRAAGRGGHEPDEHKYVGSTLTVESIRAAMIVVILGGLVSQRAHYFGFTDTPHDLPFLAISGKPGAVFFALIAAALASSLVTTMAALLCYEYATRFTWKNDWPKVSLLRKAFQLGKFGFYCLMWSLAALPVLLDYYLSFISILFVFGVMWFYYFFPVPAASARRTPSRVSKG